MTTEPIWKTWSVTVFILFPQRNDSKTQKSVSVITRTERTQFAAKLRWSQLRRDPRSWSNATLEADISPSAYQGRTIWHFVKSEHLEENVEVSVILEVKVLVFSLFPIWARGIFSVSRVRIFLLVLTDECILRAHITNWKVLADDESSILPVEFSQVTLPSIKGTIQ